MTKPVSASAANVAKALPRLEGATNFRDLAEINLDSPVTLRPGLLYRSELLDSISDNDLKLLDSLNIRAVCDLRHGVERARRHNRWPEHHKPQSIGHPPTEGLDAQQTNKLLGRLTAPDFEPEEAMAVLRKSYRRMPYSLADSLRSVFNYLIDHPEQSLLIHCTSGKDRSGFVCAVLLATLGVPQPVITRDYLLSKHRYPVAPIRENLQKALGTEISERRMAEILDIATVHPSYLTAAFAEIDEQLGGLDQYLAQHIGIPAKKREQLQKQLLLQ